MRKWNGDIYQLTRARGIRRKMNDQGKMKKAEAVLQLLRGAPVIPKIKSIEVAKGRWVSAFRSKAQPNTYEYLRKLDGRFQTFRTERAALSAAKEEFRRQHQDEEPEA